MTMAFGWEHVTSGLGALAVMLMGYQIRRIGKIEDKLDQKVNENPRNYGSHSDIQPDPRSL